MLPRTKSQTTVMIDITGRKIVLAMRTTAPEKSSNKSTRTSPRDKNDELGAAKSGKEKACCWANCWKMFSVLGRRSAFITRNKAAVAFSK